MRKKLLVTTADERTWGDDEELIFLDDFCKLYERRHVWSKRQHETHSYHWSDIGKRYRDFRYLGELTDKFLHALSEMLNQHHNVDYPIRYWRIILGPWLLTYTSVIFDRWELLSGALSQSNSLSTKVLNHGSPYRPPVDYTDFLFLANQDPWNHHIFSSIILQAHQDKLQSNSLTLEFLDLPQYIDDVPSPGASTRSYSSVKKLADNILGRIFKNYKVLFYYPGFQIKDRLRLDLALGQISRSFIGAFEYENNGAVLIIDGEALPWNLEKRQQLKLRTNPSSPFETFLQNQIVLDMPTCHLEGYPAFRKKSAALPLKADIIFSVNAFWFAEFFKVWSAEQTMRGTKIVIAEHGGSIPHLFDGNVHEESIATRRVTWPNPYHPNTSSCPHINLLDIRLTQRNAFAV